MIDLEIPQTVETETPQTDLPEENKKVLRLARQIKEKPQSILKLSKNRWYAYEDANLLELADDLAAWPSIPALGIIDSNNKVKGIVSRRDIFDLLGRPFGRDVLRRETVSKVGRETRAFHIDSNIFSVSEALGKASSEGEIHYYPLVSGSGEFAGIFSSQELLVYLSEITQKDLNLASSIQSRIVKEFVHLDQEHFELIASSVAAKGVGGDFHHQYEYSPGQWISCLCDVSGKGMAASLVTTALWGVIRSYDFKKGLYPLLRKLNRFIIETFELERFVTGIFVDFCPKDKSFILADCGHGYGYLYRDGKLLHLKTGDKSYPLGVSTEADPKLFNYHVKSGDLLILLSDGVLEQSNAQGEEFDLSKIKALLKTHGSKGLKSLRVKLLESFHKFKGSTPLQDDMTFQLIRFK